MWIHIRAILGVSGMLAAERTAGMIWPDAPVYMWPAIAFFCGAAIVIGNYRRHFSRVALSLWRWMRETDISVGKSSLGWVVAALLVVFIVYKPIASRFHEQQQYMEASNNLLRIRPICGSSCTNLGWIVDTCKREAVKIGRLRNLAQSNAEKATRYFQGCLIDKEMNWERCNEGEAECMRLKYTGAFLGAEFPSFIE